MSLDLPGPLPVDPATAPAPTAAFSRNSSIVTGRDALGNVLVNGDGNNVTVTVIVADARLRAADASLHQNPYRGLDEFRETESHLFFGRDDVIRPLWMRLHAFQRGRAPRLLPILGASGSGKSSLVRAGLLPELARQPMEGMRNPQVLVLRPGANPLQRLAEVLAQRGLLESQGPTANAEGDPPDAVYTLHRAAQRLGGAEPRMIVFVDQLEELFTECTSEAVRAAFLATLAHAASQPDGIISVVFAMRNDFAGSLHAYDAFAHVLRDHPFRISQMTKPQLIAAIEQPACVLGHPWPRGLVDNLVSQCEGRVGALPLLQFALMRLWPAHIAGRLDQLSSSQLVEDFLIKAADDLVVDRGAGQAHAGNERILRRAFVAMVQLGEGTADTRRVARLSEIVARGETGEQVRAVLAPFVAPEARLVTASELDGEPAFELAHEALIGSWNRLRDWLGQRLNKTEAETIRGELRLHRRLQYAAAAWQAGGGMLMRPPELSVLQDLRTRQPDELSARDHAFIDASVRAWEAHERWRRRARALAAMPIG